MALHYSRRMAWDMVQVMIRKIEREEELLFLPFAGVCCVIRAAIAVFETRMYADVDELSHEDISGFLRILTWFSGRWSIGGKFNVACSTPKDETDQLLVPYLERAQELAIGSS